MHVEDHLIWRQTPLVLPIIAANAFALVLENKRNSFDSKQQTLLINHQIRNQRIILI